jgi:hypothetical protein
MNAAQAKQRLSNIKIVSSKSGEFGITPYWYP